MAEGVLKLLNRIQQQLGVSYLFITHDVATLRAIADDVLVMQRGRVVDHGRRDAIFTPPVSRLHRPAVFFRTANGPGLAQPPAGQPL